MSFCMWCFKVGVTSYWWTKAIRFALRIWSNEWKVMETEKWTESSYCNLCFVCMLHSQDGKDYCWKMKTWLELKRIGITITNESFFFLFFWLSTIKIEGLRLGAVPLFPLTKYIYTLLTFNSFIIFKFFI